MIGGHASNVQEDLDVEILLRYRCQIEHRTGRDHAVLAVLYYIKCIFVYAFVELGETAERSVLYRTFDTNVSRASGLTFWTIITIFAQ